LTIYVMALASVIVNIYQIKLDKRTHDRKKRIDKSNMELRTHLARRFLIRSVSKIMTIIYKSITRDFRNFLIILNDISRKMKN